MATIQQVMVRGFSGIGIRIVADARATPKTNCNLWRINDVQVLESGPHGLYTDGGDANVGIAIGLDSTRNGGWGVYDSSFLGKTYIGCHTAANKGCCYKSDGPGARNMFLNCYSEGDQNPAEIAAPSMVIGGFLNIKKGFNGIWITASGGTIRLPNSAEALNTIGSRQVAAPAPKTAVPPVRRFAVDVAPS